MALSSLPRLTSSTPDLTRAVDLVKRAIDPLLRQPLLAGVLLEGIDVTAATPFVVSHGLGRAPVGYFVASATGSATIIVRQYPAFLPTPDPNSQLALIPSATGTISLQVY